MARSRHNDIFKVEAIGPPGETGELSSVTQGLLWLHFVDNAAALSCLVNGSSSVCEGDVIIGETWGRIQALQVYAWFDRVDTSSNPVDGLSRGRLAGPWRSVSRLAFPGSLLPALRQLVRQ